MSSALITGDVTMFEEVIKLITSGSPSNIEQAYKIDREIVAKHVDPLAVLRNVINIGYEIRDTVWLWATTGMIIGIEGKAYLTPAGSLIINRTTIRKSKSIVDPDLVFSELEKRGLCVHVGRYVYLPGIMRLTEHVSTYAEDSIGKTFVDRIEEYMTIGIDVPVLEMHILLPNTFLYDVYPSVISLYAGIVKSLDEYFFGRYSFHIENYRHIPSIVPLVLEVPVDLIVVTERDVIAHKFVDLDKTFHRGISSVMKYVEYGFDKIVLVHYSRERKSAELYRKIVYTLLSKDVTRDVGYVVFYGYEIDRIVVYKVPTFNRGMAHFKYTSEIYRNLIRNHLMRLR